MSRVALETAVLTHGLPRPRNVEVSMGMERAVRTAGATPTTIGMLDGVLVDGLSEAEIRRLGANESAVKLSLRDLPVAAARKLSGGTTVSATLHAAAASGIQVFATGGIGGVHRAAGGEPSRDVSADLTALGLYAVCTVCSGAKAILDLPATVEMLETLGVTVVGFGTDCFPAFYSRETDLAVDARVDSADEVAEIVLARRRLRLPGAVLVAVAVPRPHEVPRDEIEPVVARAVREADDLGLRAAGVTPFLLRRIAEEVGERAVSANVALLENNARVAGEIALALDRLDPKQTVRI